MDGGDDGHLAVVHGAERFGAPAIDPDQALVRGVRSQLFDVDSRLEALAGRLQDHDPDVGVAAGPAQGVRQLEPACDR